MSSVRDLKGQRFGRLVVLYGTGERKSGRVVWHCRCDCGNEVDVIRRNLTGGNTKSCGCFQRERSAEVNTVHGMNRRGKRHPVYRIWTSMLTRCENPNAKGYKNYGGRGIAVCDEWHAPAVFIGWALANGWQKGLQIDRIDNDGNYEPDNCRWTTWKEQAQNRRNNRFITFNGKTQCLADWSRETGIGHGTLWQRIYQYHWSIERALTEPTRRQNHAS